MDMLEDHEQRIRAIEKNNKLELRVEILERYMNGQIVLGGDKREGKHDTLTVIALVLSLISLILIGVGLLI